ncbi:hypothetical protein G3489_19570 [Shewanella baltica]|uniref:hypothetical protein n=1 Tax=Shewanella baltica TaxID=62322 RepID=UPI00217E0C8D|nr:hypothetical protein [Shewanella baltica]MCS6271877.1 hypothetical protein [Shewanella baltica]
MAGGYLRTQLFEEVEQILFETLELRPFIGVWEIISERFQGVDTVGDDLDPIFFVHCALMREQSRNGKSLITEELFLAFLMRLPILNKNIVSMSSGAVWEPIMESFSEFSRKNKNITSSNRLRNDDKVQEFYMWVIQLCNWDGLAGQKVKVH